MGNDSEEDRKRDNIGNITKRTVGNSIEGITRDYRDRARLGETVRGAARAAGHHS